MTDTKKWTPKDDLVRLASQFEEYDWADVVGESDGATVLVQIADQALQALAEVVDGPAHVTTVEQETELLAILRDVAPAKREDAWHLEECTVYVDDYLTEHLMEQVDAEMPWGPPPDTEGKSPDELVAAMEEINRLSAARSRLTADLVAAADRPSDEEMCAAGCPYPRARALLRAIEGS